MVMGPLRGVLWVLGGLAAVWLLLGLLSLPLMDRMMEGGIMGPVMESGMMSMVPMMLAMGAGVLALLGLVGVFIYLIADAFRCRSGGLTL